MSLNLISLFFYILSTAVNVYGMQNVIKSNKKVSADLDRWLLSYDKRNQEFREMLIEFEKRHREFPGDEWKTR